MNGIANITFITVLFFDLKANKGIRLPINCLKKAKIPKKTPLIPKLVNKPLIL
jgi:hypothetical protein